MIQDQAFRMRQTATALVLMTTLLMLGASACSEVRPDTLKGSPGPALAAGTKMTYTPIRPCRIVDTQKAGGAIAVAGTRDYLVHGAVASQGGDADGCTSPVGEPGAVHLNVTVTPQGSSGHIRAYPFGISAPAASLLNYKDGVERISNAAIVKTCHGCSKDITLQSNVGSAHVTIDVLGYFAANTEALANTDKDYVYTPVSPCRIIDTRKAGGVFAPDDSRTYSAYGDVGDQGGNASGCASPRGEPRAVHLNLTAVPHSGSGRGNFAATAATTALPAAGLLHYEEGGQNIGNAAIIKTLHDSGTKEIDIANRGGHAHLVVDVLGYYHANTNASPPPGQDYTFVPVVPCRIMDTRSAGGTFDPDETRKIAVHGAVSVQGGQATGCESPLGEPRAAHLNLAAVPSSGQGTLVVFAADESTPTAAVVNYRAASQNIANAITAKTDHATSSAPDLAITNRYGQTHLVIDVMGYFAAASDTIPDGDAGVDLGPDAGDDACPATCGPCSGGLVCSSEGQCVPPNIVLIMLDDADVRDFSIHNPDTMVETPTISTLASQGSAFDNFYTNSPVCSPTRAATLSGNYPARYGINTIFSKSSQRGLPAEVQTLAEYLKSRGYNTGHIGKWHLGGMWNEFLTERNRRFRPENQGFEHTVTTGSWKGFWSSDVYVNNVFEPSTGQHLDKRFTDHALSFLTEHQHERFFLNLAYYSPHRPLEPPPEWAKRFPDTDAGRFAALLSHTDHQLARVLKRIDALGLTDTTAVLFLSDNGGDRPWHEHYTYPLRGYKGEMFEGGIRSPLVVRWPGLTAPGSRNGSVAAAMDIYPSIVEALGDDPATFDFDGQSFLSALQEEPLARSQPLFWQNTGNRIAAAGYRHNFAVRDGPWKLVKQSDALYLFNIANDPAETTNQRNTRPKIVSDLLAKFSKWRTGVSRLPISIDSLAGDVSQSGNSLSFTGRGHVLFTDHPQHDFDDGEFAVRFRMRMGRGGVQQRIIGKTTKWQLRLGADNRLGLYVTDPNGKSRELFGTAALQVGAWYDIAVSFHGKHNLPLLVQVFVDGAVEIDGHPDPVGRIGYTAHQLKLSTNINSPAYFVGDIEDVETFAGTLTARDL